MSKLVLVRVAQREKLWPTDVEGEAAARLMYGSLL